MTATMPPAVPLQGRFVRLEPFDPAAHGGALWAAIGRPEVFAGGYGGGPAGLPADEASFVRWAAGYGTGPAALKYVVRLVGGEHDGLVVGASTLGQLDPPTERAHIGWTAYHPGVWGTQVNPECKLLLLGHAFGNGFGRVQIQADSENARSRAAILKLGAVFEGVLRRDRVRADGSFSGTAVHSILVDEWPAVRAGLEARLGRFSAPVRLAE